MKRICEPELMEAEEQARAYAEADFSSSDRAMVERILQALQGQSGPLRNLVDLGCGPGNLSFPLAQAVPQLPILAIDGAAAMLAPALERQRQEPARWPCLRFLQARLPLASGALEGLPAELKPPFAVLVSNSLLHHLHDPLVLWRGLRQLGAPGSLVVIRDLRRPSDPATLEQLAKHHLRDAPPILQRDFRASLQAAFDVDEVREQLIAAGLESLRVQELEDRYLEVIGQLP